MIKKRSSREILYFIAVGLTATAVHYVVAAFSLNRLELSPHLSNTLGYGSAVFFSYFGHSILTFQKQLSQIGFTKFLIASLLTFLTSQILLYVGIDVLHIPPNLMLPITVLSVPILSFLVNKLWVFSNA